MRQVLARCCEDGQQIFGLVFGVFVKVKEQRAFFIRASPGAVALHELYIRQQLVAAPKFVVFTATA